MSLVYLAGPIAGRTDEEANGWRREAAGLLACLGVNVLDPMTRDFRHGVPGSATVRLIVEGDKEDIRKSDAVLAFCPVPTVGTSMEILYAYMIGVPVVAVVPEHLPVSPWISFHSTYVARELRAGVALVRRCCT